MHIVGFVKKLYLCSPIQKNPFTILRERRKSENNVMAAD